MERQLLSIREVCEATGLGETLIKRLIREGRLLSVKVADRRMVPADSLRTFVAELVAEATGRDLAAVG